MNELEKIEKKIRELEEKINDPHLCEGTASISARISGYFRSVHNWNIGKQAEYRSRLEYTID